MANRWNRWHFYRRVNNSSSDSLPIKRSSVYFQVGIPGLGERRRKKLGLRKLQEMNLAQIQVLYNDLQTQIESK